MREGEQTELRASPEMLGEAAESSVCCFKARPRSQVIGLNLRLVHLRQF